MHIFNYRDFFTLKIKAFLFLKNIFFINKNKDFAGVFLAL